MLLGGEARGADAAVWRLDAVGAHRGKYQRVAPVLAVEVQGELEDEDALRTKAAWYLERGVEVVWLLFPVDRRVVVLTADGAHELRGPVSTPSHPSLPGLVAALTDLFAQIDATSPPEGEVTIELRSPR